MLEDLRSQRLYVNLKKCEFGLYRVAFLGHIISGDGLQVDPAKIEAI